MLWPDDIYQSNVCPFQSFRQAVLKLLIDHKFLFALSFQSSPGFIQNITVEEPWNMFAKADVIGTAIPLFPVKLNALPTLPNEEEHDAGVITPWLRTTHCPLFAPNSSFASPSALQYETIPAVSPVPQLAARAPPTIMTDAANKVANRINSFRLFFLDFWHDIISEFSYEDSQEIPLYFLDLSLSLILIASVNSVAGMKSAQALLAHNYARISLD
jgi:hypothetical protein